MNERHPLDPPPSDVIGLHKAYYTSAWQADPDAIKREVLGYLYERLATQQRIPVGIVEGGWLVHEDGAHVTVRMRVPTAPLLMDFAEHTEED